MTPTKVHEINTSNTQFNSNGLLQPASGNLASTISIGNTTYHINEFFGSFTGGSGVNGVRVLKTEFDEDTGTYSTEVTSEVPYGPPLTNVSQVNAQPLGTISATPQNDNTGDIRGTFEVLEVNGKFKIIDATFSHINIYELDPANGELVFESSVSKGDAVEGSLRLLDYSVTADEDGTGFTIGWSVTAHPNLYQSINYDENGTPTGPPIEVPQPLDGPRRGGPHATAEVEASNGDILRFVVIDHDRNDTYTITDVNNDGSLGSINTQFVDDSRPATQGATQATSIRHPQETGPDKTFVYFSGINNITTFEIDETGDLTFVSNTPTTQLRNDELNTITDGAGVTYGTFGGGITSGGSPDSNTVMRFEPDGTITTVVDSFPGDNAGSFNDTIYTTDLTILDSSLHIVRTNINGVINIYDTGIAAVPLPGPNIPCFTSGTLIQTDTGLRAIETLEIGDLISTQDHGLQPIRWIGNTYLSRAALRKNPNLVPIKISAHALGHNVPSVDLVVSPQHRILVSSNIVLRMTGEDEVLVPAVKLLDLEGVDRVSNTSPVNYFHILLENHEIINANGAFTETLLIGPYLVENLSPAYIKEILKIFPEVFDPSFSKESARTIVKKSGVVQKLVERHVKNERDLFGCAEIGRAQNTNAGVAYSAR